MKRLLIILSLSLFTLGLSNVRADVGAPVSITATYNSDTGQLNASGSYAWEECEPGEETNILGYSLFINGGTPAVNDGNALDGAGMHLANSGNPCTTTPDNWSDNGHILSSAPASVCVVIYDVRADDSADPGGTHSTIGAGDNHNIDNSWDRLENEGPYQSYLEGACTTPEIITSDGDEPTPESTPLSCSGDTHPDASGKNCVSFEFGGAPQPSGDATGGQVLGASTMAKTGAFEENLYVAIMGIGAILTFKGLKKAISTN